MILYCRIFRVESSDTLSTDQIFAYRNHSDYGLHDKCILHPTEYAHLHRSTGDLVIYVRTDGQTTRLAGSDEYSIRVGATTAYCTSFLTEAPEGADS